MKFSLNPTFRPSSCFTHQYKNSTQFRLYASLIASQNTKSLSACDEYASTSNTSDSFISTLPIGTHIFRVQTVHSDFVDQNKEAIWGYGTMLTFGSMNGYRAILYLAANGRVYIRHYASETPHYGWMRIL